jgi:LmbE family N-acetylglucosaminyl deacetylase
MNDETHKSVAIIVAHPDDEILWAGGTILSHPLWTCFIICLCRKNDEDRAPKFHQVLKILNAKGIMGNLDDAPEQFPLDDNLVQQTIMDLLNKTHFDLIITHNPTGEYTKHLRHEEVSKAVINLWEEEKITTTALWTFAYEDGNKAFFPKAVENAPIYNVLPTPIWVKKYDLMTQTYGFKKDSWEALTTPKVEAFWAFEKASHAVIWLNDTPQYF